MTILIEACRRQVFPVEIEQRDFVRALRKATSLASFSTDELMQMKEAIDGEMNARDNGG